MKKIGLLIIATNKYISFLTPLIESADKHFLKNHDVTYFIFTNVDIEIETSRKIIKIDVEHKPWPWMTLGRYDIFTNNSHHFLEMDYLYYCDADMLYLSEVGEEIFGDRVATQHCCFVNQRGTPETNNRSTAYISPDQEMQYFAGGFNGGTKDEYLKMAKTISRNVKNDFESGIIAIWHDESHLNRYFIDNKPTTILSPSYCYGEPLNIPYEKKILALVKDHSVFQK